MKNIIRSERVARDSESSFVRQNNRSLSATSWNFQTSAGALRAGTASPAGRAFRKIGQSFFDVEAKRQGLIDGAVFGAIGAFSVWPIVSAAQALFALIK